MAKIKSQPNLLEGNLFLKILQFVIPLMLTNLLQMLYNAADMIVVGMSGVDGALGSIGTTTSMITLILNAFIGFSVGTNVTVARAIGAKDRGATQRAVHTTLCMAAIFGIIGCAIGQLICRPILILLGDEGHILELATLYARIYFAGAPFIAMTNFCIAIFRAKGDTKTPLVVLSISGAFNVVMNLIFVLFCGMSVDGVSLATVLSQVLSSTILIVMLCRDTGWCRVQLRKLKMHWKEFKSIIHIGVPAAIQGVLFAFSNMAIQSSIVRLNNEMYPGGSAVIDGHAAAGNLEGFAYTLTNAVAQAAVTFTSQHFGAGMLRRIAKVRRNCYLVSALTAILVSGTILLFQRPLVSLYVKDPAAMDVAAIRGWYLLAPYFLLGFMEVGSYVLRGLGKSVISTIISLLGAGVFRVLWVMIVFEAYPTLECVYLSYPISWILTAAAHFILGQIVWKKELRKQEQTA